MHCPTLAELPPPPPGKTGWPWMQESPQLSPTMPDSTTALKAGPSTTLRTGGSPWPRISIITPSYNQGRFLEETIRSVLLQGYPNLEYMVIDGGSTDGSEAIIRKYEPWLSYWVSEKDGGQSQAINKGWARATGEIMAWLNSDDVYAPGMLGAAVQALSLDPEAAVVYSNSQWIDEHGVPIVLYRSGDFDLGRLLRNLASYIPQPTTLIRRPALADVGFLDETLHYSMDYELWLRLGMRYPLHYVDADWAATRKHNQAKTTAFKRPVWEQKIRVLRAILSSPYLPANLHEEASTLYSTYYLSLAGVCLLELGVIDALRYLKRAILLRPTLILDRQNWWKLLDALLRLARGDLQFPGRLHPTSSPISFSVTHGYE